MAMVQVSNPSLHRMMKDINEIKNAKPLLNVSGMHLDEDMFEWHINIRPANEHSSRFSNMIFHLIAKFPSNYPSSPPLLKACTLIPHPNVIRTSNGEYEVCLEMFNRTANHQPNNPVRPYEGWSSAFSVYSVLMQLQSILIDGHEYMTKHGTAQDAILESQSFRCNICNHNDSTPVPSFPSTEDIENFAEKQISIDSEMMKHILKRSRSVNTKETKAGSRILQIKKKSDKKSILMPENPNRLNQEEADEAFIQKDGDKEVHWTVVQSKRNCRKMAMGHKNLKSDPVQVANNVYNHFNALQYSSGDHLVFCGCCKKMLESSKFSNSQLKKGDFSDKKCQSCVSQQTVLNHKKIDVIQMTNSQRKNFLRRQKKRERLAASQSKSSIANLQKESEPSEVVAKSHEHQQKNTMDLAHPTKQEKKPIDWKKDWTSSFQSLGFLKHMSFHLLTRICSFLGLDEVMSISSTCKYLAVVAEDGMIWSHIFSKRYPRSNLIAENIADWKYAFLMEVNNIQQDICCWYTKVPYQEDVVGIPLDYTVNPKTQKVDYISSSFDLLSRKAFYEAGVRHTVWNEPFKLWLPLYLTEDHFQRALPFLRRTFPKLCPQRNTTSFDPLMILEVIPTIMNTIVVLIADSGICNSERVLEGYCQIHRLFIALIEKYPSLQNKIEKTLHDFITNPSFRTKQYTPGLGQIICLLSVSKKFDWAKLAQAYITESFDRNVLWVCKEYPELAQIQKGDQSRLDKVLAASKVRFRHLLFHVYFLQGIVKQASAEFYDVAYGSPPTKIKIEFQKVIKRIKELSSWPEFFRLAHLTCPSPEQLTYWLETAVGNSLKKGYHSKETRFHAIQKSGVSKILLKGESYTVPPNLNGLRLEDRWAWNGSTRYLDASLLFFDFGKNLDVKVDYITQLAYDGAVLHSGDIIDDQNNRGTHIVELAVRKLPPKIQSIVFVLSAFSSAKLKNIIQPAVHVHDSTTGMELCSYTHDSSVSSNKAVIMSCLWRKSPKSSWQMDAFGFETLSGDASNYKPIIKEIKSRVFT